MTPILALSSGTVAAIVVIVVIDLFAIFFALVRPVEEGPAPGGRRGQRCHPRRARPAGAQAGEPARVLPALARRSLLVFSAEFGGDDRVPVAEPAGWVRLADQRGQARRHPRLHQRQRPAVLLGHRTLLHRQVQRQAGQRRRLRDRGRRGGRHHAAYQRCVHLGCRCRSASSRSGSSARARLEVQHRGEYKLGPAPRGWTGSRSRSARPATCWWIRPSRSSASTGTDTIRDPPSGPFCVAVQ